MADDTVVAMERRLVAGRDYLAALRKLGFHPDALLWAFRGGVPEPAPFELLIISTWADSIGPKAIYDLLFEAYDASATPKEIDPFIVSLFSHHTKVATDMGDAIRTIQSEAIPADGSQPMLILGMMDYITIPQWIISYRQPRSNRFDDLRRFGAFQTNVTKLAA